MCCWTGVRTRQGNSSSSSTTTTTTTANTDDELKKKRPLFREQSRDARAKGQDACCITAPIPRRAVAKPTWRVDIVEKAWLWLIRSSLSADSLHETGKARPNESVTSPGRCWTTCRYGQGCSWVSYEALAHRIIPPAPAVHSYLVILVRCISCVALLVVARRSKKGINCVYLHLFSQVDANKSYLHRP